MSLLSTDISLKAAVAVVGVLVGIIIAMGAVLWWRGLTINGLREDVTALESDLARVIAVNQDNEVAFERGEDEKIKAEKAVSLQTSANESTRAELRAMQHKNVEVARNAPDSGTRIPSAVADSLRMQHKTANRYAVRSHTGDAAPLSCAGAGNTASARRDGS